MAWKGDDRVRRAEPVLEGTVDDDLVLFRPDTGRSLGVAGTGIWIWQTLAAPLTVGELIREATAAFDVPRSVCAPDIIVTLNTLHEHQLIDVEHA